MISIIKINSKINIKETTASNLYQFKALQNNMKIKMELKGTMMNQWTLRIHKTSLDNWKKSGRTLKFRVMTTDKWCIIQWLRLPMLMAMVAIIRNRHRTMKLVIKILTIHMRWMWWIRLLTAFPIVNTKLNHVKKLHYKILSCSGELVDSYLVTVPKISDSKAKVAY